MRHSNPSDIDRSQRRLIGIWLADGITSTNVIVLCISGMMTMVFVVSIGLLNPYLLHEHLQLPIGIQGNFTGTLAVTSELMSALVVIPAGLLSDRIGRRQIFVAGFLITAISFFYMPLVTTPGAFITLRAIAAMGFAACLTMLASAITDYPQNASRGRLIGLNGMFTGIGVALVASLLFAQLPEAFSGLGFSPVLAGTYTYWIIGGLALVMALSAKVGLHGNALVSTEEHQPFAKLLCHGIDEVRRNPRLSLACATYFVSRGDLVVLVSFFSLWIVAVGVDGGMTVADAQGAAGRLFGISQVSMILFTPVVGQMVDRLDRVTALAIAMAIASAGYFSLGFVGDPFSSYMIYPVVILAGAGEACIIVCGPALVGQEAPPKIRGSIIGLMSFFGAIGVLIHSKVSGALFDELMYQAPFIYMAALNFLICCGAFTIRLVYGPSQARVIESN